MSDLKNTEQYILLTTGFMLGMILSYTGLLGFITGVGTSLFLGNRYERMTKIIIETCKKMIGDKSKQNKN